MKARRPSLDSSLRTKVLVPVLGVMVLLLLATVVIVNSRFQGRTEANFRGQLAAAKARVQHNQEQHRADLQRRFESLAKEPVYRAAFLTLDPDTMRDQLERMFVSEELTNESVVFAFFSPQRASVPPETPPVVQHQEQPVSSVALTESCRLAVLRALRGEPAFDTLAVEGQLFNVVAIPVANRGEIVGVLAFGEQIGAAVAGECGIGAGTDSYTALIAGERVIASTLPPGRPVSADPVETFHRLIRGGEREHGLLDAQTVGSGHFFCAAGNFPSLKGDQTLGYLLYSSYEDQLAARTETEKVLLAVSLVTILAGSVIVWFFVNRATRPLLELRDSAEAVGRGDFSRRVQVRSRDECGELAAAFNHMTANVQQAQAELQHTVKTLKTTQAQLVQSEKLSAVGEFVAGVAHELNNPLAAVMGFSELLKDAPVDEKYRRHLELIFKSALRCRKIVQSLLSFARRHPPERKPVSVNRLIEEVLEIVAYQLRTSNVDVVCHFAQDLPLVLADGHQIQQVILNLINNARQAIEGHQDSGRITVTTGLKNHFLRLTIEDNGPGIPPENLSRIFDPFFTTKEVGKGTGLGLSLCYGLVQEHGGRIIAASEPGKGATFTIDLPATPDAPLSEKASFGAADLQARGEGVGKKILLVDDEEILLEMVGDGLKRHGYEVVTARGGEEALRELQTQRIDAICTDIKMPGLNGRRLFDSIRATRPETARRVIFMTGDVVNESLQLFLEQEQVTCLTKPFELGDLRQAIKKTLCEANGN
jgi:signal transduction histidine kinase/CheY-like chemotaxis protein